MLPRNVLIFHLGALGDFVLTWPLALALGRLYPQSRVFYVTSRSKGALAERVLRVEATDVEAGWHALFSADGAGLPAAAEKLLAGAHAVFSFVSDGRDAWAANVRRVAGRAELVPLVAPKAAAIHVTEAVAEQLGAWPVVQTAVRQILRSVAERGVGNRAAANGSVVLHPGSGSPAKCWPLEKFCELAERLRAAGRGARFVVGEVELERWAAADVAKLAAAGEVVRPADYLALLDVIAPASAFVGNDSGPGHLAGALGVATVSLFGPASDPVAWRPLGPRVRVLSGPAIDAIGVDAVLAAVMETDAAPRSVPARVEDD